MIEIVCATGVIFRIPTDTLEGIDLSGQDLHRAELHGRSLVGARLDRANLRGAWFEGASLQNVSAIETLALVLDGDNDRLYGTTTTGQIVDFGTAPNELDYRNTTLTATVPPNTPPGLVVSFQSVIRRGANGSGSIKSNTATRFPAR